MSLTYIFAGSIVSPGQLEEFKILYLLTVTEQPAQTVTVFLQTTLGPNGPGDVSRYLVNLLPAEEDLPFPEFEAFLPATLASDLFFGLALTNPFDFEVRLDIEAFAPDGTLISGEEIVNPATLTVGAGEQVAVLLEQLLGSGILEAEVATLLIRSHRGQIAALFLLIDQDNRLLDGSTSQTSTLRNFVLPNIARDSLSATTNIQVFNPSATESVDLELTLRDGAGSVVATRTETLGPRATLSEELSDLMDVDPSSFEGGFLQGVAPADLVAWETFGDLETLNILNAQSAVLSQKSYQSPHFAVGGGLDTELSLVNNDAIREGAFTVTAIDEAGVVLDLPTNPAEIVLVPLGQRTVRLSELFGLMPGQSASGSLTLEVEGILVGFIQVFPRLSASLRFLTTDGRLSATLPLLVLERSNSLFPHVAQDLGFFTGVATLNPQEVEVVVTIEVFDELGTNWGPRWGLSK